MHLAVRHRSFVEPTNALSELKRTLCRLAITVPGVIPSHPESSMNQTAAANADNGGQSMRARCGHASPFDSNHGITLSLRSRFGSCSSNSLTGGCDCTAFARPVSL